MYFGKNRSAVRRNAVKQKHQYSEGEMTEKMNRNDEVLAGKQTEKIIKDTTAVGVAGNVVLSAFKLIAGITGRSNAMISDAIHSLSDVFATLIAYIGLKISEREPDKEHPYGHERLECIASMLLAVILFGTGISIGWECVQNIVSGEYLANEEPGRIALAAAVISIVSKEAMYHYTLHQAKRIRSGAFEADAWHHRSDAMSSVGALAGIGAARLGFPVMDSVAGLIICMVILYVAAKIMIEAVRKMLDTSAGEEYEEELCSSVRAFAEKNSIDTGIDSIVTRTFGEKVYVDMEISLDGNMSLKDAHDISEKIHDHIEKTFPEVKHVMVHINPSGYSYSVRS